MELEKMLIDLEVSLLNKNISSSFVRCRMMLLFGYYGTTILSGQQNRLSFKYLRFVVNSIKSKKNSPLSVTLIAIDSLLKTIFNKKFRKNNMLIKEIFKLFVKKLPSIQYPQFYELLESIIK